MTDFKEATEIVEMQEVKGVSVTRVTGQKFYANIMKDLIGGEPYLSDKKGIAVVCGGGRKRSKELKEFGYKHGLPIAFVDDEEKEHSYLNPTIGGMNPDELGGRLFDAQEKEGMLLLPDFDKPIDTVVVFANSDYDHGSLDLVKKYLKGKTNIHLEIIVVEIPDYKHHMLVQATDQAVRSITS